MEEPLPAGGSCLLGSINLAEFVTEHKTFNFIEFRKAVAAAVKGLNDVLDEGMPLHPLQEQRDSVKDWRQIGLGIMSLADCFIKMEVKYGSPDAVRLSDMIGQAMADEAIKTSALLAKEYGSYPMYHADAVLRSEYFNYNALGKTKELVRRYGLRNSQLLTTAPTGTISSMLGISGGIEPIFANSYTRKTESLHGRDEYYKIYTPIVQQYMSEHRLNDDSELPEYFVTSQSLEYRDRLEIQAVWQKHIDASISSTVNVPNSFTVDEVEDLYVKAWQKGLKGITIYREGCKRGGILSAGYPKNDGEKGQILERGMIIKADDNCIGKKRTIITGCGTLHCEAFFDPDTGELLETYFSKGSSGGCHNFMIGLSRMISLAARGGIDIYSVADQLQSSGTCPSYAVRRATKHDTSKGSSCPVAIGNALLTMYEELQHEIMLEEDNCAQCGGQGREVHEKRLSEYSPKCPVCGEVLFFEGGCNICKSCGWSKCE